MTIRSLRTAALVTSPVLIALLAIHRANSAAPPALQLISATSNASGVPSTTAGNQLSVAPFISDDGDKIAFSSQANNITPATDSNTWGCAAFVANGPLPTATCQASRDMYYPRDGSEPNALG